MESAFGREFSSVRVHESRAVSEAGATAYASGERIGFAPGSYRPETPGGRHLIAHELAHVVQQRAGRVGTPQYRGRVVTDDSALEREADRAAARAVRGERVRLPGSSATSARTDGRSGADPVQLYGEGADPNYAAHYPDLPGDPADADFWTYDSSLFEPSLDATEQFRRDAIIWAETLTRTTADAADFLGTFRQQFGDEAAEAVGPKLDAQQRVLKRHFVAMTIARWAVGANYPEKKRDQALWTPADLPLVALASHGARFMYSAESSRTGQMVRNLILAGDPRTKPSNETAGMATRPSTHSARIDAAGNVEEQKLKLRQLDKGEAKRMAFPIGGLGNRGPQTDAGSYLVGPKGWQYTEAGEKTTLQHGSALFKLTADDRVFMAGVENARPGKTSPVGGSHGASGVPASRGVTGGYKGASYRFPMDVGGMASRTIDAPLLHRMNRAIHTFETLDQQQQERLLKTLLLSRPSGWDTILTDYGIV
jgi:hypothetical protein